MSSASVIEAQEQGGGSRTPLPHWALPQKHSKVFFGCFFHIYRSFTAPPTFFPGSRWLPRFHRKKLFPWQSAAELKRLRPFAAGKKGKAMRKREMTIAGIPLQPIRRGKPAVIREANGCRQTTPVLWVDQLSSTEVTFETQNTVYHLRVMAVLRGKEAHRA